MARDCPTPKGKGKGDYKGSNTKGGFKGGKATGKGDYNGYKGDHKGYKGYPQKGAGKGFQGACWNCGKTGHRSSECRGIRECTEDNEDEGAEECAVEIGGVWDLACVEKDISSGDNHWDNLGESTRYGMNTGIGNYGMHPAWDDTSGGDEMGAYNLDFPKIRDNPFIIKKDYRNLGK